MQDYELLCVCGNKLLEYSKKEKGVSKYCYLKQLPLYYLGKFQCDLNNTDPDNIRLLTCRECHHMIGRPVNHNGELAFLLKRDRFKEKEIERSNR